MLEIEEMSREDMKDMLRQVGYGHLGCSRNNEPYVVPVHYAYSEAFIYLYTTEGKKVEIIRENPRVCLQVESVTDNQNWKSVIVTGDAEQVVNEEEREKALEMIAEINPTLMPAVSVHWMDSWVRENVEVILRLEAKLMTGRATVEESGTDAMFAPDETRKNTIY
jgi:nitroimidazol reductase NimA-like FMN-containing flavoprotein (pyridoxamine 5'-phosphate oxidase superfamily)